MKNRLLILVAALGFMLFTIPGFTQGNAPKRLRGEVAQMVPFEFSIDLETGQTCFELIFCFDPAMDMRFAFNATLSNPTVLAQQYPAQLAILPGVPFNAVDETAISNGLVLADVSPDVPFGPGDTAVIRTVEGNYFKVGLALCFTNDKVAYPGCAEIDNTTHWGVRFHYQQLL